MTKKSGVMIDESWKIPDPDRRRIAKSLGKRLRDGVDIQDVLAEVESATQNYRACHEAEREDQKPSQIARELKRVADCTVEFPEYAAELSAALDGLGPEAGELLKRNWQKLCAERPKRSRRAEYITLDDLQHRIGMEDLQHRLRGTEISDDLRKRVKQLRQVARDFQPRGRPQQDAMGSFINILALIYQGATGRWPGRTWNEYEGRDQHPFFESCFHGAGMPPAECRRKLAMVRPILERGKHERSKRSR